MKNLLIVLTLGYFLTGTGNVHAFAHTEKEFSFSTEYKICDQVEDLDTSDPNDVISFILRVGDTTAFCWITDNDPSYSIAKAESSKVEFIMEEQRETAVLILKFGGGQLVDLHWVNGFYVLPGTLSGIEIRGPSRFFKIIPQAEE